MRKISVEAKPYNLTYFIRLSTVTTFVGYKYVPSHRKPYKMFSIGGFIMKTKDKVQRVNMMHRNGRIYAG